MTSLADIQAHWNQRATLGATAGTQDLILKQLEQRAILEAMSTRDGAEVLEIGCGHGELARLIVAQHPGIDYLAVDSAGAMIVAAIQAGSYPQRERLRFRCIDVADLPAGPFDVVITERMLINLPTWELQQQAIAAIGERLRPGGLFLMCEHSQDGLDAINETRVALGLEPIVRPWHNRYIDTFEPFTVRGLDLVDVQCFSAEYYFLSRIVNAKLAQLAGEAPRYDAPINALALALTGAHVAARYAQARLWIWEKP